MTTKKVNLCKLYFLAIGINLIISLIMSPFIYNYYKAHNQARMLNNMLLIFMHLILIFSASPFFLLKLKSIIKNPTVSFVSSFSGILITIIPIIYFTTDAIQQSSMHNSDIIFIYSSITLLISWTIIFRKATLK